MVRNWKRRVVIAGVILTGLAAAGGALARPGGGGCGGGEGHALEHLERRVARAGLPPATSQAIYDRIDRARSERRSLDAALDEARDRMRSLLEAEPANLEAVMAQADAVGALETQGRKLGLRTLVEIRGLVTPEQWQALAPRRGPAEGPAPEGSRS